MSQIRIQSHSATGGGGYLYQADRLHIFNIIIFTRFRATPLNKYCLLIPRRVTDTSQETAPFERWGEISE